jgi:hypothetical protein
VSADKLRKESLYEAHGFSNLREKLRTKGTALAVPKMAYAFRSL